MAITRIESRTLSQDTLETFSRCPDYLDYIKLMLGITSITELLEIKFYDEYGNVKEGVDADFLELVESTAFTAEKVTFNDCYKAGDVELWKLKDGSIYYAEETAYNLRVFRKGV